MGNHSSPDHDVIRRSIGENAVLSWDFVVMNGLAGIVATYGLLADSPAVVIGVVVLALLIGPMLGIALALVDGHTVLLRKAAFAEFIGVVMKREVSPRGMQVPACDDGNVLPRA